ncbi:MAG: Stp1/IreP family PP2C-type Ser/Thr phosphatase [Gemmatimonadota bacterium]
MTHPSIHLTICAKTDLGRTRDHNEDTFLVADLTRKVTEFKAEAEIAVGERGVLFMVADGMGGAAAGEVASAMARDVIFSHVTETWLRTVEPTGDAFMSTLRGAVELANDRIHAHAREHPEVRGMGTTATVAGVLGNRLYVAQVGDSRAYMVRDGEAVQLTKDQSLMQRLIDAGELTEEEAEHSERRNIILQALGPDARIRVDVTYQDLSRGDTLVICSDGLSGQVKREEIGTLTKTAEGIEALCDSLIELANERGGPDNITVVVARFAGLGLPEPANAGMVGYQTYPLPDNATPVEPPPAVRMESPLAGILDDDEPDEVVVRRSGSPATIGVVAAGILALLGLAFWLLTRR